MQASFHVCHSLSFRFLCRVVVVFLFLLSLVALFTLGFLVLEDEFNRRKSWSGQGKYRSRGRGVAEPPPTLGANFMSFSNRLTSLAAATEASFP